MPDYREQSRRQGGSQESLVGDIQQKLRSFMAIGLSQLPADELVSIADKMGKHLKDEGLKTTQVRRFLDGVRKIDVQFDKGKKFNKDLVILLKPKLAYAAGRNQEIKPLMQVLEPAITAGSKTYMDFKRLLALIEGVIAYHRFYGGKDS